MKFTKDYILAIVFIFGGLFLWNFYSFSFVPFLAKCEVNQMIQKHNVHEINHVAANRKTKSFLLKLKKSVRCDEVSDFQGGSDTWGYYPADINGQDIGIVMRKKSWIYWQIENISYYPRGDN